MLRVKCTVRHLHKLDKYCRLKCDYSVLLCYILICYYYLLFRYYKSLIITPLCIDFVIYIYLTIGNLIFKISDIYIDGIWSIVYLQDRWSVQLVKRTHASWRCLQKALSTFQIVGIERFLVNGLNLYCSLLFL